MMTHDGLREEIVEHLTVWFRDLGVETHQIENTTDAIMDKVKLHVDFVVGRNEGVYLWPKSLKVKKTLANRNRKTRDGLPKEQRERGWL